MINIYLGGEKISYTAGDTFSINVSSPEGFEDGSILRLCVAENEKSGDIIEKEFFQENGVFSVELSDEDTEKLTLGEYIYKLVLISAAGETVTQKSGELSVKWGA